jgi:hypothetical protein
MDPLRHNQVDHLVLRGLEIGGKPRQGKRQAQAAKRVTAIFSV